jgi:hypothetical protein
MPRIISFSFTTPALVNGFKDVTRRIWKDHYAAKFAAGDEVLAYDKTPRAHGKAVARLRLTHDPVKEDWADAPDRDWLGEGFAFMCGTQEWKDADRLPVVLRNRILAETARNTWADAKRDGGVMWVVRFELLELLPGASEYLDPRPKAEIPLALLEMAA